MTMDDGLLGPRVCRRCGGRRTEWRERLATVPWSRENPWNAPYRVETQRSESRCPNCQGLPFYHPPRLRQPWIYRPWLPTLLCWTDQGQRATVMTMLCHACEVWQTEIVSAVEYADFIGGPVAVEDLAFERLAFSLGRSGRCPHAAEYVGTHLLDQQRRVNDIPAAMLDRFQRKHDEEEAPP